MPKALDLCLATAAKVAPDGSVEEVQLYAFDVLALGGEDLRPLLLSMRKTNLARLLRGRPDGMFVAPFEAGEIGPDLFRAACRMGPEGLVSKRRVRRYSNGRSTDWIKVEEPDASGHVAGDSRYGQPFSETGRHLVSPAAVLTL